MGHAALIYIFSQIAGNVMCLDVLRAMRREPAAIPALLAELDAAKGVDSRLDASIEELRGDLDTAAEMARNLRHPALRCEPRRHYRARSALAR